MIKHNDTGSQVHLLGRMSFNYIMSTMVCYNRDI